jgi:hypothetical protein
MSEYRDCKRELEVVEYVGKDERGEDIAVGGTNCMPNHVL